MSQLWKQRGRDPLRGFRIRRIGLNPPREKLYATHQPTRRVHVRGWADRRNEVAAGAIRREKAATPLASLGYKQAVQFLGGELTREQAIAAAQQGHRNYAKRQMTWFRREPDVVGSKASATILQLQSKLRK